MADRYSSGKSRAAKLRQRTRIFFRATLPTRHGFLIAVALVIGIIGGYGAIGFRLAIGQAQQLFYGSGPSLIQTVEALPRWLIVLLPAIGGMIVGPIVYFLAPESKGHGVPEVMEAVALRNGAMRPRVLAAKLVASAVCIGSGGSVGREGPIVQIGSSAGSILGQLFRLKGDHLKVLVGCGAAAGIAATFNAPIAGALFAAEIILGDFEFSMLSPVVLSSVMATVVSRHYLGDFPAFEVPQFALASPVEIIFYMSLGVLAGIIGVSFTRSLYACEDFFEKIPLPGFTKPLVGGIVLGVMALFFPHVLGLGYESIEMALGEELELGIIVALLFLKTIATSVTLGAGGSGGIFAPSLFIGAMTGSLVGWMVSSGVVPIATGPTGAYALVGMAAVVSATTHGPITAILILFELTGDYKIILPVMCACVISILVANRLFHDSIYTLKLTRRGVQISRGREVSILRSLRVETIILKNAETLQENATFDQILAMFVRSRQVILPVVDAHGRLQGIIRTEDLKPHVRDEFLGPLILARDVMSPPELIAYPDENLEQALTKLVGQSDHEIPVVARDDDDRLLGLVSQRDLLNEYEKRLRQLRVSRHL